MEAYARGFLLSDENDEKELTTHLLPKVHQGKT
jgi:hypothetical protein